jgi:HEPN domain-containing protein
MPNDLLASAIRWFRQAEEDLKAAENLRRLGTHYAACFFAQQAAEKALKAALLASGQLPDRTHAVLALARELEQASPVFAGIAAKVGFLDQYYVPTRYPDALPGGVPADLYGEADSQRAIAGASLALDSVRPLPGLARP